MFKFKDVSEYTEVDVDDEGRVVIRQAKPTTERQTVVLSIYDIPTVIFALRNLLWEGRDRARAFEQDCDMQFRQSEQSHLRQPRSGFDDDLPF